MEARGDGGGSSETGQAGGDHHRPGDADLPPSKLSRASLQAQTAEEARDCEELRWSTGVHRGAEGYATLGCAGEPLYHRGGHAGINESTHESCRVHRVWAAHLHLPGPELPMHQHELRPEHSGSQHGC